MELEDISVESLLSENCISAKSVGDFGSTKNEDQNFEDRKFKPQKMDMYCDVLEALNGKAGLSIKQVDQNHPFYSLAGSDNIIAFTGEI